MSFGTFGNSLPGCEDWTDEEIINSLARPVYHDSQSCSACMGVHPVGRVPIQCLDMLRHRRIAEDVTDAFYKKHGKKFIEFGSPIVVNNYNPTSAELEARNRRIASGKDSNIRIDTSGSAANFFEKEGLRAMREQEQQERIELQNLINRAIAIDDERVSKAREQRQ